MRRRTPLGWLLIPAAAFAGDLVVEVRDAAGRPVPDAAVLIFSAEERTFPPPAKARHEIDQIRQEFVPYVKVVPVGAEIFFPNKDNIRHQVYSFSPAKRFELPLYSGRSAPPVKFEKPGIVVLGCNIHDWMLAYVYVTDAPFYGQTGAGGRAAIPLPPGEFIARIWHPLQKEREQDTAKRITVPATGAATLQWTVALRADNRPHRHPGAGEGDYR